MSNENDDCECGCKECETASVDGYGLAVQVVSLLLVKASNEGLHPCYVPTTLSSAIVPLCAVLLAISDKGDDDYRSVLPKEGDPHAAQLAAEIIQKATEFSKTIHKS